MSPHGSPPWYDRFFSHEYLTFDEHPHTDLEIDFLLRVLQPDPGARILDICCGYGRHAVPLAKKGYTAVGIDRSPVMLDAARRASPGLRLPLLRADMRALPFAESFHIALNLFSSFGYFDAEDDNFRVLQSISGALSSGGRFLIETVNRDFIVRHSVPTQVYRPEGMLLIEERQFDPLTSRSRVDVTVVQNGKETRLYHSIRLYTLTELKMLLTAVGLAPVAVWGDFQGADYTCDSPHMILLSEKP